MLWGDLKQEIFATECILQIFSYPLSETILQNTYRKSAKWVISEAKGIITSPSEEYYIIP